MIIEREKKAEPNLISEMPIHVQLIRRTLAMHEICRLYVHASATKGGGGCFKANTTLHGYNVVLKKFVHIHTRYLVTYNCVL